jgi:hypothetical protein
MVMTDDHKVICAGCRALVGALGMSRDDAKFIDDVITEMMKLDSEGEIVITSDIKRAYTGVL